jgi:COMPASS component SWD1
MKELWGSSLSQWHPSKSSIASTTNQGNVLIWHCPTPERWGAFAGGFEEVDENVEYEEKENEFDVVSLSELNCNIRGFKLLR